MVVSNSSSTGDGEGCVVIDGGQLNMHTVSGCCSTIREAALTHVFVLWSSGHVCYSYIFSRCMQLSVYVVSQTLWLEKANVSIRTANTISMSETNSYHYLSLSHMYSITNSCVSCQCCK